MIIHVLDVETTGLEPEKDDAVVQIAACLVAGNFSGWFVADDPIESFVNPHRTIPATASGVHHIIDADVAGAPDLGPALDLVLGPSWQSTVEICCAHHCRFDMGFLPMLKDRKWVDTYRCSLHVWPDAPAHSNQVLRYWLGLDLPRTGAHNAASDVIVTAHILCRLLAERSVEDLLRLSQKAVLMKKVGFGMHYGELWTDVPISYLEWAAKKDDFEPDVKFTIKSELARRRAQ
jgi:exodeoxyribonuclease X